MICKNGIQKTPKGETGYIFECQLEKNKKSHCRFAKWCGKEKRYVIATDFNGKSCQDFVPVDLHDF